MKRYIQLNGVGGKFVAAIALVGVIIPAILWALSMLGSALVPVPLTALLRRGSLIVAGLLLALFTGLIGFEQVQDCLYDRACAQAQDKKLPAPGGYFECQYCGNRRVEPADTHCGICGKKLA